MTQAKQVQFEPEIQTLGHLAAKQFLTMLQNYFKIALRSLLKQKTLSFINILGLSIGLSCFSLFLLYVVNEFSYNRFHEKVDRIHRVVEWSQPFGHIKEETVATYLPMPLGPALKEELPDVEQSVRLRGGWSDNFVRIAGQVSQAEVSFADPAFFSVFTFPLKYGTPATALPDPYSVVLTEEAALRLFGEPNPTGKTLEIKLEDRFEPYTVRAVAENIPANSSIEFDVMLNFERAVITPNGQKAVDNWHWSAQETYVLLRPGSGLAGNAATLQDFHKRHYPDQAADMRKAGTWKGAGEPSTYRLQPLLEMHTGRDKWLHAAEENPTAIWTLLLIASGVLLIACINFTTLAIGRSAGRAREVGVRKVIGSSRGQLVGQFLAEALLMSAISGVLGLALAQAALPYFNEMADRQLAFSLHLYPEIAWMALGLTLLAGLLAGAYPAVVLSNFRPIEVLKSKMRLSGSNFFTKALVTTQFVLSIGLAVSTGIVVQQVRFMRTQDPGFQKENVVVVNAEEAGGGQIYPRFRQQALLLPGVKGVASSDISMGHNAGWSKTGWDDNGKHREAFQYWVDDSYLDVLGMQLVEGKGFEPNEKGDHVVINESLMKAFGWTPETALGQILNGFYSEEEKRPQPVVAGVVKDFHFRSMKEAVGPQLFMHFNEAEQPANIFFVRLQPGDPTATLSALEEAWKKAEPVLPFKFTFLDEDLDRFYQSEARLGQIIGWAGGLSIFLACLGLFGLAALSAVNRTKEIGVRKVLGASVASVVGLLSKELLTLVILSLAIASPLAYYFMSKWLQDFAYRIDIQWYVFVVVGLAAVGVAFLTVSFQSMKAALANPVKSLRSE